ncbi:hypothetical protein FRC12_009789 [Ceratobasidium sp. 428]|nr:hypothetical protein FRC12_009789 [Ceratobasidium sp. 428]
MVPLTKSWGAAFPVGSIAVSPDGARVGGAALFRVELWDIPSGEILWPFDWRHDDFVRSVAYSPDGRMIASGSDDMTIRVWDTTTGVAAIEPLEGHKDAISSVTFSHDGRLIISGSSDKTIRLWDVRTGRSAATPIDVGAYVMSVAVSPDGSKIVGGGEGGTMKMYDAAAGTMLCKHTGHTDNVNSVAFSPDGRCIASGSDDMTIRIWDAATSSSIGDPLQGHTGWIRSVVFSPDSRYIASGSDDKTIRIWDAATGVQTDSLHSHTDAVLAVAFTPDGSTLASASLDQTVKLWDVLGLEIQGNRNGTITLQTYATELGGTPNLLPPVRSLVTAPPLFDEITSTTTPEDIILLLGARGCANLTDQLDPTTYPEHPFSSGGLGDIYRCKLKDDVEVAIKTLRLYVGSDKQSQKGAKHAAREIYTWSKCQHPNVQRLLGLVMFRGQIGMVAAWEANGDMPRYLERNPRVDRCDMIVDGLAYLHKLGIVHGDLKGANVLISEDGSPRLADFGSAASQETSLRFTLSSTGPDFSLRWAAPELFLDGKCNVPTDIYALGMTILETLTGKVPFPDKQDRQIYGGLMSGKLKPIRPEAYIPTSSMDGDKMWSLLQRCWEYEPEKRPSAAEVQEIISQITRAGLRWKYKEPRKY